MKIKYLIISLLVMLASLFYACKKSTSEEIASPIATCEFTVKGHYNDTIMPNTILYFYDNEAKYEASKSSLTGDSNAVLIDTTDSKGKLTVDLSANKQYWVRAISKAILTRFNNLPYYFNNDGLSNSSLVLMADKKQKTFYTLKVDNQNPYSLLVVYSSDNNLINAKVQVKNKSTNKIISKSFGTSSKDSITQVSVTLLDLGNTTLGDNKKYTIYLVKKGTYTIKTLSTNGLVTTQDVDIEGEGKFKYVDIKGKEIATAANGVKFSFFSTSLTSSKLPCIIFYNNDSVGYFSENSSASIANCSNNSANIFSIIVPRVSSNKYLFVSKIANGNETNHPLTLQNPLSTCASINIP